MDDWIKVLSGLVILSLVISGVAFFKQPTLFSEKKDALDKIKETSTITACYISYPPFSVKNLKTGQMEGISIDIIENIAKKMGTKVEYVETTWSNIVLDLKSERLTSLYQLFNACLHSGCIFENSNKRFLVITCI